MTEKDLVFMNGRTYFPTVYYVGKFRTKFFEELRDNKKIFGVRCAECDRVYVPPRATCPQCFNSLSEWRAVGNQGVLLTYSTIHYDTRIQAIQPKKPPYTYGIIKLDGADTGFLHFIDEYEVHGRDLRIGARVEAVFKEVRTGSILDIVHFRPI